MRQLSYNIANYKINGTHECEYTPGTRALIKDSGSGFIHLSGFHSHASGPHSSGLRLVPMIDTYTVVPLEIGMASIFLPLVPLIGAPRGKTMSCWALWQVRKVFTKDFVGHNDYLLSDVE